MGHRNHAVMRASQFGNDPILRLSNGFTWRDSLARR